MSRQLNITDVDKKRILLTVRLDLDISVEIIKEILKEIMFGLVLEIEQSNLYEDRTRRIEITIS